MELIPLIQPGTVKGLMTAQQPTALPSGFEAFLQNVRFDGGVIEARDGDTEVVELGGEGTGVRGVYAGYFDGVLTAFVAIGDGSSVKIYKSIDLSDWGDELTSGSGPYGSTRLADDDGRPVWFTVVADRRPDGDDEYDLLIIQNGVDAPRIYGKAAHDGSPFGHNEYGMAIITQPMHVPNDATLYVKPVFHNRFHLLETTTVTNEDDSVLELYAGIGLTLFMSTSYSIGVESTITFTTPVDLSHSRQLMMVVSHEDTLALLTELRLEISDGTNYHMALNRFEHPDALTVTEMDGLLSNTFLVAIDIPSPAGAIDMTAITRLRFGLNSAPSDDSVLTFYAIAGSGAWRGQADLAVSYASFDTRATGPGRIIERRKQLTIQDISGVPFDEVVEELPTTFFDYEIGFLNVTEEQRDNGIDALSIYMRENGQAGYYYLHQTVIAYCDSGAWHYEGGTESSQRTFTLDGSIPSIYPNLSAPAATPDTVVMPVGRAMVAANGRLFVAQPGRLWFSDFDQPFQFRKAVTFAGIEPVPSSGGSFAIDGQIIQQLTPIGTFAGAAGSPGALLTGAATVFIHTDSNLYALAGSDSQSLSSPKQVLPHGTLSPFSVSRNRQGFYWLDQEGEVRTFGQLGNRNLSMGLVDDITKAIPASRRIWVSGACRSDRYHLLYAGDRSLVWNERISAWESSDSLASSETKFLLPFYHDDRTKLGAFADGGLFEYAKPGEGVTDFLLRTREHSAGFGRKVLVNGCAILCDAADATISIKRFTPGESADAWSPDGSIDLNEETPRVWKIDQPGVGAEGASFQLTIEVAEAPAGWRFYSLAVETEQVDAGGPARD